MPRKFRIACFAHAVRSDWNYGSAHFPRGWMRRLIALGRELTIFEPEELGWDRKRFLPGSAACTGRNN